MEIIISLIMGTLFFILLPLMVMILGKGLADALFAIDEFIDKLFDEKEQK